MTDDDDGMLPPVDVVPALFSAVKTKRDATENAGFRDRLMSMRGRIVDVTSNGFGYRGLLIGADEEELYLRAELRWLVMPLERISSVREVDEKRRPMGGPDPRLTGESDAPRADRTEGERVRTAADDDDRGDA